MSKKRQTVLDVYRKVAKEAEELREAGKEELAFKLYWVVSELEDTKEVNP